MALEKCLTDGDVKDKLVVPAGWLGRLPPFEDGKREVQFGVLDDKGFHWLFFCAIRNGDYPKPVLQSQGWHRFVEHKGLKVGDKIILHPEVNHFRGTLFQIRAQRSKNDGQWVNV